MACSDLEQPDASPVSPDWIRWIRLASARPAPPKAAPTRHPSHPPLRAGGFAKAR